MCPSVQCSGPVLFPQESNFIVYILTMLQNCLCLHLYLYIFVGKNIKNWFDLKSRFVWLFKPLRPSSANASWALLHCRENFIFFALEWNFHRLIYVHLLQNCGKIHWIQSSFKKEKETNLSFWIQSTFKQEKKKIFLFGSNPLSLLIRSSPVRFV